MPLTLDGNGTISGLGDIDGHDLETNTLVNVSDATFAAQAVGRATLFIDESTNTVGINTTTPAAAVFLEVADGTNPIISLNNTTDGEVRLGCRAAGGYIGTVSNHPFNIEANSAAALTVLANGNVGINQSNPAHKLDVVLNSSAGTQQAFRVAGGDYTAVNLGTAFEIEIDSVGTNGNRFLKLTCHQERGFTFQPFEGGPDAPAVDKSIFLCPDGGSVRIGSGLTTGDQRAPLAVIARGNPPTDNGNPQNVLFVSCPSQPDNTDAGGALSLGIGEGLALAQIAGRKASNSSSQFGGYLQLATNDNGGTMREQMRIDNTGKIILPDYSPGIQFGTLTGNATSNTLDDYEEGTFTLVAINKPNQDWVENNTNCKYIKTGNVVHIWMSISFSSVGATNNTVCNFQLPFAPNGNVFATGVTRASGVSNDLQIPQGSHITASVQANLGAVLTLNYNTGGNNTDDFGGLTFIVWSKITENTGLNLQLTYTTANFV